MRSAAQSKWMIFASCRWVLPFIGHMGICTSSGVIRDFAGSYFVSVSNFCTQCIHLILHAIVLPMAQESPVTEMKIACNVQSGAVEFIII